MIASVFSAVTELHYILESVHTKENTFHLPADQLTGVVNFCTTQQYIELSIKGE